MDKSGINIVVLDGYVANPGDLAWDELEQLGNLIVYDRTAPGEIIERAAEADVLFVNKCVITAEIISALPRLKYIGEIATGYNNIDIEAAHARGIIVTNVPAYSGHSVAQQAMALLLEITNRVGVFNSKVHEGEWCRCRDFSFTMGPLTELDELTLGIYGLGDIGMKVAEAAHALGMKIISSTSKPQSALPDWVEKTDFDTMLARADVLSLNAPLTQDNEGLFNADVFARLKTGAIIINTARGQLIDEQALADAIRHGKIAAAGLDVLAVEPPKTTCPLLADDIADRVVITPHVAWQTVAARRRLLDIAVDNLRKYLAGTPTNVVD